MSGMCVCSLMAFGSRMECHASKNNLRDRYNLTSLKSKSKFFCMQCCAKGNGALYVNIARTKNTNDV